MAAKKAVKGDTWVLGCGSKYEDRGQSCFGSVPELVSWTTLEWDPKRQVLFTKQNMFLSGCFFRRLPMPVETAETLLLKFLEPLFFKLFLDLFYNKKGVEVVLETNPKKIKLLRYPALVGNGFHLGAANIQISILGEEGGDSLLLSNGLRRSFADRMEKLSPDDIRKNLREGVPA